MENQPRIYFLQNNNELIIYLIDHITALYSYSLFEYLKPKFESNEILTIWIDLSKTNYIDSTTIGTLIKIHTILNQKKGKLIICNISRHVKNIISQSHLSNFFTIIKNENLKTIEETALKNIECYDKKYLTEDFILDAHHNLVNLVPELKKDYETLFNILDKNKY